MGLLHAPRRELSVARIADRTGVAEHGLAPVLALPAAVAPVGIRIVRVRRERVLRLVVDRPLRVFREDAPVERRPEQLPDAPEDSYIARADGHKRVLRGAGGVQAGKQQQCGSYAVHSQRNAERRQPLRASFASTAPLLSRSGRHRSSCSRCGGGGAPSRRPARPSCRRGSPCRGPGPRG